MPWHNLYQKKSARLFWLVIGLLTVAAIIALIIWLKPTDNQQSASPQSPSTAKSNAASTLLTPTATASSTNSSNLSASLPPMPRSLQGTEVDGEIIIDEHKQLIVTQGLRRLFDYFLTAQGEEPLATIRLRVIDYIKRHTPEPAASQAISLFEQYLAYLQAVAQLEKSLPQAQLANVKQTKIDVALINQQQQAVKALRQRYFDEKTRKAFFANEDALNDYTLQVIQTNQNNTLSDAQKQQSLQQAREAYIRSFNNPQVQQKIREQDNIARLLAETTRLKQQGASEAELNAMRRKYVNETAVQRLSELDKQENAFTQRIINFDKQRQQILQSQGNTPQAQSQIEQLKNQQFSLSEQLRLEANLSLKKDETNLIKK